jgi:hypothetical protein
MKNLLLSILVVSLVGILMVSSAFAVTDAPPDAGKLGDEHEHASLLVKIFGDKSDFSVPSYQIKSSWIHFEDRDGNIIHRHASGVNLGYLFDTLNIDINSECYIFPDDRKYCTDEDYSLKYYINHRIVNDINDYVIEEGDRILISFGGETPKQIEEQLMELDLQVGTSHEFDYQSPEDDSALVFFIFVVLPVSAVIIIVILIKKNRRKNKDLKQADSRINKQKIHLSKMEQSNYVKPTDTKKDSLFCVSCGTKLKPKAKFCSKCGATQS